MTVTLVSPPTEEPLTLTEAKQQLRVDHTAEDTLIRAYIAAARLHVEAHIGLFLLEQTWQMSFDADAQMPLKLSLCPLMSIDAVTFQPVSGPPVGVPPSDYTVYGGATDKRLDITANKPALRPFDAIQIEATFGFGSSIEDIPEDVRQAVRLLVAHWYENREAVSSYTRDAMTLGVKALLAPYRRPKL